jgi:hydroxypyruvate isomerase
VPKFAANLSMLFTELPFPERFGAAKAAGFEGVEFLFPYEFEKSALSKRLREQNLVQVLHNLPAGNWSAGERGIAIYPERVLEFRQGVQTAIEYARELGCNQLNCLAGICSSGGYGPLYRGTFVENLRYAASELAKHRIKLLVEPINTRDIPGFFLTGTDQAAKIIEEVGSDNLFIQYDIYHMQVMEGDLARTIERHSARIAHVQLADNPGRNEPGTGEINYPFLYRHLDEIGYGGWIGCEYRPKASTTEGLGWFTAQKSMA